VVEKIYRCDLCGGLVPEAPPSGQRPGRRLKFGQGIDLCILGDGMASEKVICGPCLTALKAALTRE
jgi:hypothetical protein